MATYHTMDEIGIELWNRWRVTLRFRHQLRGGTPKSEDVQAAWIRATVADKSQIEQLIAEAGNQMNTEHLTEDDIKALQETGWNGFKESRNGTPGLIWEGRCLKAMLKEAAEILRETLNMASLKPKVAERVFVEEDEIFLDRIEPDGSEEAPIHVMTRQGPRTALKRVDYIIQPNLTFHVRALKQPLTNKAKDRYHPAAYVRLLLEYAQELGAGAERSQGYGKFDLIEFEPV